MDPRRRTGYVSASSVVAPKANIAIVFINKIYPSDDDSFREHAAGLFVKEDDAERGYCR